MTLIRKNYPSFHNVSNWFDDFFTKDLDVFSKFKSTVPSVNIKEEDTQYIIELAVPGMKKEDFDIDIDNNIISISTNKEEENKVVKENYTKREFCYSEFRRAFTLPEGADVEKISAEYKDGILTISIAKKEEEKLKAKRKIDIK